MVILRDFSLVLSHTPLGPDLKLTWESLEKGKEISGSLLALSV